MNPKTISNDKFNSLLERVRQLKKSQESAESVNPAEKAPAILINGKEITYNEKQREFINLTSNLKSCVLLGAAGTGKTTCMMGMLDTLCKHPDVPIISYTDGHKYLPLDTPGIILTSFTRRSVSNDKRVVPENMKLNCMTIHKLLEFEPVTMEVYDEIKEEYRNTLHFLPKRTINNPLPAEIRIIVISEASMVSVELFEKLRSACHPGTIFIFTGDIQQLPPVFGSAILGYKMLELPVIELTEVYRQALDSPIIKLAHRILSGNPIPGNSLESLNVPGKLLFYQWKKKFSSEVACAMASKLLTLSKAEIPTVKTVPTEILETFSSYNPEEDIILCPFNKSFGTIEINKRIANHIAKTQNKIVHEIISGYEKHYFSIGDKVLYDKEDGTIIDIQKNTTYLGKRPRAASTTLDYWGLDTGAAVISDESIEDVDLLLDSFVEDDKVNQASHCITIRLTDTDQEITIYTASDINATLLGYALTVHKSQGSEWRRVFLLLHNSHATMIQRELLYTAVTRAKESLYIICDSDTFVKGITNQRIKGNTLQEKAEYFKGKLENV